MLRSVSQRVAVIHRHATWLAHRQRCLATSKQKRELNLEQLEGKSPVAPDPPTKVPPVASTHASNSVGNKSATNPSTGTGTSTSTSTGTATSSGTVSSSKKLPTRNNNNSNNFLPYAIAGAVVIGGGSLYYYQLNPNKDRLSELPPNVREAATSVENTAESIKENVESHLPTIDTSKITASVEDAAESVKESIEPYSSKTDTTTPSTVAAKDTFFNTEDVINVSAETGATAIDDSVTVLTPMPSTTPRSDPFSNTTIGDSAKPTGNRVFSIHVPSKMKNVALPYQSSTSAVTHPVDGNRVSIYPPSTDKKSETSDSSMTQQALDKLKKATSLLSTKSSQSTAEATASADTSDATEAVIKSHQSLWASLDEAYFSDLDALNTSQLKARVVQLATEMKDRTKWEAVRLKEFLAMKEKETAEKYIELMQRQRLEFEDLIATRLREQETRFMHEMQATLQEKETSNQSLLNAALEKQKEAHEDEKKAMEEKMQTQIKMQLEEQYGSKFEQYKNRVAQELQSKVKALKSLSEKISALEAALQTFKSKQQDSLKAHRLSAAAMALAEKLESNQSLEAEMDALKSVAGEGGVIATALATIPPTAKSGVPTLSQLQTRFEEIYPMCRQAALVPTSEPGLFGQLFGMAHAKLAYAPNPDDPAPEDDEGNAVYALVRAKKHVQLGDLSQALEQLDKFQGQVAFVAADWKEDAKKRVAVDKAVKVIKMECALTNESLLE